MGKVRDILRIKGNAIFSVTPTTTIYEALELMVEKNIGALLVSDHDKLVGIFTERDYARKVILKGKSSRNTTIEEAMTANPFTVTPDASIDECMQLMSGKKFRHIPVILDERLVGMISIGDVVKFIIDEQHFIIKDLERYITGHHTESL